jgi:hypothetical protein
MTDEEKRFDRREEARLDDMYDAQYEVNPAEIHTCSPQREWQGLTDGEIDEIWLKSLNDDIRDPIKVAQEKLKDKNSG